MKNQLLCKHNILTLCVLITVLADAASGRGVINGTNQEAGSMRVEKIIYGIRSSSSSRIAPYTAYVKYNKGNDKASRCAGVVIDKEWVLTAAHCVHNAHKTQLQVFVGARDLEDPEGQHFSVRQVTWHGGYKELGWYDDNDIALLRLEGQIDTSKGNVKIAAHLANGMETFDRKKCVIAGWGATEFYPTEGYSDLLMEMTIPKMISQSECEQIYAGAKLRLQFSKSWREHHICVLDVGNPHSGACSGDSGGPLICGHPGHDVLVGIGHTGPCDRSKMEKGKKGRKMHLSPDTYTRVEPHLQWIFSVQQSVEKERK